jgi:hypothetical protein
MDTEIFNPLDKRNLGVSIADAIFKKEIFPLKELPPFNGAGIYAIYYKGNFPLYKKIRLLLKTTTTQDFRIVI